MKQGFIYCTFVIDKSGSMWSKVSDVIGGFNRFITEQKEQKEGETKVSIYMFNDTIQKTVTNEDIDEVQKLNNISYCPGGNTALNDAIGIAIDETGKFLSEMKEEDRPSKVIVVVMTDGYENSSKEYSREQVKEMIKHQEDKYSWDFVYIGADMTSDEQAKSYGFKNSAYGDGKQIRSFASVLSKYATNVRCAATMDSLNSATEILNSDLEIETSNYERSLGIKIKNDN